jgi:hypothetical protein
VNEASVVTEFRWIEAGGSLPVLCLHGLFGASDHWERLVEAVSPRCRAMALSLPIFELPTTTALRRRCTDRPPDLRLGSWGAWFGASPEQRPGPYPLSPRAGGQHSGQRHNGVVTTQSRWPRSEEARPGARNTRCKPSISQAD